MSAGNATLPAKPTPITPPFDGPTTLEARLVTGPIPPIRSGDEARPAPEKRGQPGKAGRMARGGRLQGR